LRLAIEEHGAGNQFIRVRSWPHAPRAAILVAVVAGAVASLGTTTDGDAVTYVLALLAAGFLFRLLYECAAAVATIRRALKHVEDRNS
jgi:hypothetical protein